MQFVGICVAYQSAPCPQWATPLSARWAAPLAAPRPGRGTTWPGPGPGPGIVPDAWSFFSSRTLTHSLAHSHAHAHSALVVVDVVVVVIARFALRLRSLVARPQTDVSFGQLFERARRPELFMYQLQFAKPARERAERRRERPRECRASVRARARGPPSERERMSG